MIYHVQLLSHLFF